MSRFIQTCRWLAHRLRDFLRRLRIAFRTLRVQVNTGNYDKPLFRLIWVGQPEMIALRSEVHQPRGRPTLVSMTENGDIQVWPKLDGKITIYITD